MNTYGDGEAIHGDMLNQRLAKAALPILVNIAQAGETIFYSELAEELTLLNLHDKPIHHRLIGKVAGCIADALIALSTDPEDPIPPLSTIVVSKGDESPGNGVNYFLEQYFGKNATNEDRREQFVEMARNLVFEYDRWDEVLEAIGVEPVVLDPDGKLSSKAAKGYGGGEGEDHKRLKEYVLLHPELVTNYAVQASEVEHLLPSADLVDVYFQARKCVFGIEIKGIKSSEADILRGIYQCLKYRTVIEARELIEGTRRHVEVVLIIAGELTPKLISIKNTLGVNVMTGVIPN